MCQPLFNTCIFNVQISFFFFSLIYESLLLITLVIRSFVSSNVEYSNAEEVAIRNIVFPGKISQGSLNVSFSSFLMMDKILNSTSFVIIYCCKMKRLFRIKFESLCIMHFCSHGCKLN